MPRDSAQSVAKSLDRLKTNLPFLTELCKNGKNSKIRRKILGKVDGDKINCLCECVKNVAMGAVPVESDQKNKLKRHKGRMRDLINTKTGVKKKRELLIQSGGFLPLILAPILGAAGSLIGDAIASAVKK